MAEIKNNFVQSKMNKDLDARLVPNGQYRDAQNIVISKSDGDDVGTVQNILGNVELSNFGLTDKHLSIIGYFVDELRNNIYVFITNYTDSSVNNLSNFAPPSSKHYVCSYNGITKATNILVEGNFLNFSTISPITGVDMIEQSLFFTDNRNQPRKINVETALTSPGYYVNEDQISIIKYYPFQPISLIKNAVTSITPGTGQDAGANWNYQLPYTVPPFLITVVSGTEGDGLELVITSNSGSPDYSVTGVSILNSGIGYGDDTVLNIANPNGNRDDDFTATITTGLVSTMTNVVDEYLPPSASNSANPNPTYDPNWPGDKDFLQDKFIKFSYRFKFEDNEYSLLAPFTQTCFVPRQDGYFVDFPKYEPNGLQDSEGIPDEEYSYISTTNRLMFNQVNNIQLVIPCPPDCNDWNESIDRFKISEVEIIYKDAAKTTLQVVDNITSQTLRQVNSNLATYDYQSRKPIKTLPENVLTRTSDKAPIRAEGLSCVGNRVVFSNYFDKHTSPSTLSYNVSLTDKTEEESIEYPNHTVKQNRTYQVGVILSDRYGRQSDVILSEIDNGVIPGLVDTFSGSTVFNSYRTPSDTTLNTAAESWNGEKLQVIWAKAIPEVINSPGYPGIYSPTNPLGYYSYRYVVKQQEQDYYNVYLPSILRGYPDDPNKENTTTAHISLFSDNINKIPKDLTDVGPETKEFRSGIRLFGRVSNLRTVASGNAQFYPTTTGDFVNTIGTQEDLNIGSSEKVSQRVTLQPTYPTNELNLAPNTTLKPGQVRLGAAISIEDIDGNIVEDNAQIVGYQLGSLGTVATKIRFTPQISTAPSSDIAAVNFKLSPFYNATNNPLIARISTFRSETITPYSNLLGDTVQFSPNDYFPINLAVYETEPVVSNLDIFYETTAPGIISDLNTLIVSGQGTTPYSYSTPEFSWFENTPVGSILTTTIYPTNAFGQTILDPFTAYSLTSVDVLDANGVATPFPVNAFELLVPGGSGGFFIKLKQNQSGQAIYFGVDDANNNREFIFNIQATNTTFNTFNGTVSGRLSNIAPSIEDILSGTDPTGNLIPSFRWGSSQQPGPSFSQGYLYIGSLIFKGRLDDGVNSFVPDQSLVSTYTKITNGTLPGLDAFTIQVNTQELVVKYLRAELITTGLNWISQGEYIGTPDPDQAGAYFVQQSDNYIRSCRARINASPPDAVGQVDARDNSVSGLGIEIVAPIFPQIPTSSPDPNFQPISGSDWNLYFSLVDATNEGTEVKFGPIRFRATTSN